MFFDNKVKSSEVGYIDDIKEAILTQSPRATKYTLYLIFALVLAALAWAHYAVIPIVSVGNGKVMTSKSLQVIQNLEGGIIKEISVKQGDIVKEGQILARFDDTRFSAAYKRDLAKKKVLEAEMIRLRTEARGGDALQFDDKFIKDNPDLVAHARSVFRKNKESLDEQLKILRDNEVLIQKELSIIRPLAERGAVSELEQIRLERQLNTVRSQLKDKEDKSRNEARDRYNAVKAEYTVLLEQITASADRTERTVIKAPMDGVVNKIYISTIGQVISPGVKIMDIVPVDGQMSVVLRVAPADIGFMKVGQKATVKVSAYDYTVYGSLDAKIVNIGADVITNKEGNDFYEVKLQTDKNYLGSQEKPLRIMPGMAVTANIVTGEQNILSFLIKPFIDIGNTAFQSR